ncbi:MAG: PAS domain S-box protein [Desulfovibrio sp.]|nr:MAG: PAS domain S-box protein [Desulfovibrio sp.]
MSENERHIRPRRPSREDLELRIQSLEEQARFTLDVLEMAATLGDFQTSINKLQEPTGILRETASRVQGFIHFRAAGFYLVNEPTSDFVMTLCRPEEFQEVIEQEVAHLIDNGIFTLALRENRPITVYSRDKKHRLVLHALSTSSRTRGLFVGLLQRADRNITSMLLSLLTIILKNCANAIESFELYRLFRENEQRYRDLANALPLTIFELDPVRNVSFVNAAVTAQFGYPREDVERINFVDLLAWEDREQAAQELTRCFQSKRSGRFDSQALTKSGETFAVEVLINPIMEGETCTGLRGVVIDRSGLGNQGLLPGSFPES